MRVELWNETGNAGSFWFDQRGDRANPQAIALAVGDLRKRGFAGERMVAYIDGSGASRLLVLSSQAGSATGAGFGFDGLVELTDLPLNIGTPQSIEVAVGDLDGDFHPEVIVAQEQETQDSQLSAGIGIVVYKVAGGATFGLTPWASFNISSATLNMRLAAADTDRDGRAEVLLAYQRAGSDTQEAGLLLHSYDVRSETNGTGSFLLHNQFFNQQNLSLNFSLALAVDDMNRDGGADLALATANGAELVVRRLSDSIAPGQGFTPGGTIIETDTARKNATQLALGFGDVNNDSLLATYTPRDNTPLCKDVIEPQITAAVFTPPYWQDIQNAQNKYGSIGEYRGFATSETNEIRTSHEHSISAYFGFEIDAEVAEVAARVTGGYNWETSTGSGTTISQATTESISFSNSDGSFVALEEPRYNCYNYQVEQQGSVRDGALRYCAYQGRTRTSVSLDAWDQQYGAPSSFANQWAPVAREWANLTLFRSENAAQSSSDGGFVASRAADGDWRSGGGASVSRTQSEANPWWQIDLGSVQDITKVRIYGRDDACSTSICTPQADLRVFLSDVDPRTIANDPAALQADSRVKSFVLNGGLGELTNLRTLQANNTPTRGRFVRVQRAGSGVLALNEVQVYGGNQIDPDRYPLDARDLTPNDGVFEVKLYNPRATGDKLAWVLMHGNLRWQASNNGPLNNVKVGNGGTLVTWSLQRDYATEHSIDTSSSNTYRVGAEFDVAAGVGAKITAGGAYEFSTTFAQSQTRSTGTSNGLELGGEIGGFPTSDQRPLECEYTFKPFYYDVIDQASSGYQHAYLTLDYLVPDDLLNRADNLGGCRASDAQPPVEPAFTVNYPTGAAGSRFVLNAQNFSANSRAVLAIQEPGATTFRELATLQMNNAGALVFVLATATGVPLGQYNVRITVDTPGVRVAASQTREAAFVLAGDAPPRTDQPLNTPTITLGPGGQVTVTRYLFLPALSRE
ncbi:MAG: discoidin domain-containing protein [Roseiflexaceae bacterium]|nr:discoidin domain-containing protein [Roseiflexaceae bacterium]